MKRLGYAASLGVIAVLFPAACSSDDSGGNGTGGTGAFDGGGALGGFGNFGGTGATSTGGTGATSTGGTGATSTGGTGATSTGGTGTGGSDAGTGGASANDSCVGLCGSTTPAPGTEGCYCDEDCVANGDCCEDAYTVCGGSCVGKCGSSDTSGQVECYCTPDCVGYGDCCKDYATTCSTDAGTGGTGGTDAGTGGASGGTGGVDAGTGGASGGTGGVDAGTGGASGGTGGSDAGTGGSDAGTAKSVWINELHYNNASTDADEGVEIAGTASTDLTGYSVVFYNGSSSTLKVYDTKNLSGTLPNQQNGYGTLWFPVTGVQNGDPDGLALLDKVGKVLFFLSYGGTFTATDGAASGMLSVDIGVAETDATLVGESLQLTGTGNNYAAFTWTAPAAHTRGLVNTGQTLQ